MRPREEIVRQKGREKDLRGGRQWKWGVEVTCLRPGKRRRTIRSARGEGSKPKVPNQPVCAPARSRAAAGGGVCLAATLCPAAGVRTAPPGERTGLVSEAVRTTPGIGCHRRHLSPPASSPSAPGGPRTPAPSPRGPGVRPWPRASSAPRAPQLWLLTRFPRTLVSKGC